MRKERREKRGVSEKEREEGEEAREHSTERALAGIPLQSQNKHGLVSLRGRKGLEVGAADRCTAVPCGAGWEEGLSGGRKIQLGWEWGGRPLSQGLPLAPGAGRMWTQVPSGSSQLCHGFSQEPV